MKFFNKKNFNNRGMSYVELIVVLSIFSILSSVAVFNYSNFQNKIDVKNLASEIALKIFQAQKESLSGRIPPPAQIVYTDSTWKPSYGVYFNRVSDNKSFWYFVDLKNPNQNKLYDVSSCPGIGECLEKISITKGNSIQRIDVFYTGSVTPNQINDVSVLFTRPDSSPVFRSSATFTSTINYIQVTVISPKLLTSLIKIYPSGRIQIN